MSQPRHPVISLTRAIHEQAVLLVLDTQKGADPGVMQSRLQILTGEIQRLSDTLESGKYEELSTIPLVGGVDCDSCLMRTIRSRVA